MVSLQPFAFRKILLLIAALIWLTSAVVIADPVLMSTHASGFACQSNHSEAAAPFKTSGANANGVRVIVMRAAEQNHVAPPAEAPPFSMLFEHLDTWNLAAHHEDALTFWSVSLER